MTASPRLSARASTSETWPSSSHVGRPAPGRGARATSRPSRRARRALAPFPGRPAPARARGAAARRALRPPARGVGRGARAASTSSSRPEPRRARRSRSTCPCSTRSRASRSCARSTSTRRRRSRRTRRARSPRSGSRACAPAIYDGDTPGERRWQIRKLGEPDPHEPGHAPRRHPPAPRPLGRRALEPALRRRRRGARLPRRLRLARRQRAAPAAPARAASTAPSRSSCSRRRRSRTPASSRTRCSASTSPSSATTRRRARSGRSRSGTRRCSTRSSASARRALGEAARLMAGARRARPADDLLREEPPQRRADPPLHRRPRRAATAKRLAPYRAGYTPAQRREIERRLVEGELLGVAATDALELGIDIGLLDCAISVGFPGTVASLRQQWGRAGRRGHGLAVLVASEDALDQYFMREPDALLGRRVEAAILDHANPRVLDGHVRAAAFEAPIDDADARDRSATRRSSARRALPELERTPAGFVWAGSDYPAARISLRSASAGPFTVVEEETGARARPRRARARVLDRARRRHLPPPRRAVSRRSARPRGADARSSSRSAATGTRRRRRRRHGDRGDAARRAAARARARASAASSSRSRSSRTSARRSATQEAIDLVALDLPETTFETEAVWYVPRDGAARRARARCRSCSARCTRPSTR